MLCKLFECLLFSIAFLLKMWYHIINQVKISWWSFHVSLKDSSCILPCDIEEEFDKLYLKTVHELTRKSTDVLTTISWYKIYDPFVACTDACEHIGECVGSIMMKNT